MKIYYPSVCFSVWLLSLMVCAFKADVHVAGDFDKVKVEGGYISGTVDAAGDMHVFKGIPFAAKPVGELRWKAPQPVTPWNGVKVCDRFSPSPMQNKPVPFSMWSKEFLIPEQPISEDCLYLNVWTGAKSSAEKRPVLVWIYGGGFVSGGSAVPIYDGAAMAKKGIVFVSANYRVGIFGFFAHPALTKESREHASGNYGLLDQVAALKWVHKNIEKFGGDPGNVTIAGQSAGSMSVNCLVASPLAKGLFQRAIAESGASFTNDYTPLQRAEEEGEHLMQSLHIENVSGLRALPATELLKKTYSFRGPVIDGYVLPDAIANIFRQHRENKVDLLTGWNEDEGLLFNPVKSAAGFKKEAADRYGADAAAFLRFYPATNDSVAAISQLKLSRDIIFGVQNYTWANMQSRQGGKVYVYRFTRKPPATGGYVKYGAFHTAEVPYAYGNLQFVQRPWEQADYELEKTMLAYWANFARTGNPNGPGLPAWQPYNPGSRQIMILGKSTTPGIMTDYAQLDLLYKKLSSN